MLQLKLTLVPGLPRHCARLCAIDFNYRPPSATAHRQMLCVSLLGCDKVL